MKLSDVMGAADLAIFAEIGLVLFMAVFLGVVVRVCGPGGVPLMTNSCKFRFPTRPCMHANKEMSHEYRG